MIAAVPKLKIEEIFDSLSMMMEALEHNDFSLRRVQTDLKKLVQANVVSPALYQLALSLIHNLRGEMLESVVAAKNAFALAPSDQMVMMNVLTILITAGQAREAVAILNKFIAKFEGDKEALAVAIRFSHDLLQFEQMRSLSEKYALLAINDPADTSKWQRYRLLSQTRSLELELTDEDCLERLQCAADAVNQSGHLIRRLTSLTSDDGTLLVHLHVDGTYEDIANLNFTIADALVSNFDDPGSDMFTMHCLPISAIKDIHKICESA